MQKHIIHMFLLCFSPLFCQFLQYPYQWIQSQVHLLEVVIKVKQKANCKLMQWSDTHAMYMMAAV